MRENFNYILIVILVKMNYISKNNNKIINIFDNKISEILINNKNVPITTVLMI